MRYNSLKFFREHYRIPSRIALKWCVICERTSKGEELRPGVMLCGTRLYIDIAWRRLLSTVKTTKLSREMTPAVRTNHGDCYLYSTDNGRSLTLSKSYIEDIYYSACYREGMEDVLIL